MTRIAAVLAALVLVLPLSAGKLKNKPFKEKRFDAVVISSSAMVEGRYRGMEDDHVLELRVTDTDAVTGTIRLHGSTSNLTNISRRGNVLTATESRPDGTRRPLRIELVNRVLNGETAYGALVSGLDIRLDETTMIERLFFARVSR
jgi:hypothetical protein